MPKAKQTVPMLPTKLVPLNFQNIKWDGNSCYAFSSTKRDYVTLGSGNTELKLRISFRPFKKDMDLAENLDGTYTIFLQQNQTDPTTGKVRSVALPKEHAELYADLYGERPVLAYFPDGSTKMIAQEKVATQTPEWKAMLPASYAS